MWRRMGTVTDPSTETTRYRDTVDGEVGEQVHGERVRSPGVSNPSESNGVHHSRAGTVTDSTGTNRESIADGEPGAAHAVHFAKPAIEFSPAPPHIHRGASGGIFRGPSGGIRRGASGGIGPHRGPSGGLHRGSSGGIYRAGSGGIHLPKLTSITFSMSRLPEEDAGVQMHFTETKEEESPTDSPLATDEEGSPRKKSRMRKHLTIVGACSFGFRLAETVLSLIVIAVMCSNSQSMRATGADLGTLRFNHFQAYRYCFTTCLQLLAYRIIFLDGFCI